MAVPAVPEAILVVDRLAVAVGVRTRLGRVTNGDGQVEPRGRDAAALGGPAGAVVAGERAESRLDPVRVRVEVLELVEAGAERRQAEGRLRGPEALPAHADRHLQQPVPLVLEILLLPVPPAALVGVEVHPRRRLDRAGVPVLDLAEVPAGAEQRLPPRGVAARGSCLRVDVQVDEPVVELREPDGVAAEALRGEGVAGDVVVRRGVERERRRRGRQSERCRDHRHALHVTGDYYR